MNPIRSYDEPFYNNKLAICKNTWTVYNNSSTRNEPIFEMIGVALLDMIYIEVWKGSVAKKTLQSPDPLPLHCSEMLGNRKPDPVGLAATGRGWHQTLLVQLLCRPLGSPSHLGREWSPMSKQMMLLSLVRVDSIIKNHQKPQNFSFFDFFIFLI